MLVLIVTIYWFEVPMRGSIPLLFGMCVIYLFSTLGLGLFISTIANAAAGDRGDLLLPGADDLLSGFIFDREHAKVIQPLRIDSLRYFS